MHIKKWMMSFIVVLFTLSFTSVASSHVTVHPKESSTDAWEKYSVRIPVEKDINTTKVELNVPKNIHFVSIMPVENWTYTFKKDDNDNITSVTWTATDKGIAPNEFAEFYFVASNPSKSGEFSWEAYQTYEDGSVVEWNGPEDADEPASITHVVDGNVAAPHVDNSKNNSNEIGSKNTDVTKSNTAGNNNWLPLLLSAIAILLALISLFRKRDKNSRL